MTSHQVQRFNEMLETLTVIELQGQRFHYENLLKTSFKKPNKKSSYRDWANYGTNLELAGENALKIAFIIRMIELKRA